MADPKNAQNHSATTTIGAPASVVFAIVADPTQHARIDGSGSVQAVVDGPDRLVLGSTFGMSMKRGMGYQTKNTVVEYEADRLIAWRNSGANRWRYELSPTADGGTRVTETWDLSPYPAPARFLLNALLGRSTQRALEATLVKLKDAAEADAAAA